MSITTRKRILDNDIVEASIKEERTIAQIMEKLLKDFQVDKTCAKVTGIFSTSASNAIARSGINHG